VQNYMWILRAGSCAMLQRKILGWPNIVRSVTTTVLLSVGVVLSVSGCVALTAMLLWQAPFEMAWTIFLAAALLLAAGRSTHLAASIEVDYVAGRLHWRHLQNAPIPSGSCLLEEVLGVRLYPSTGDSDEGDVMLVIATLNGSELPVGQIPVVAAIDRITMIADAMRKPRDALIDSAIRRMVSDYPSTRATQTFLTLTKRGLG
jgi:hypothetical protein